MEFNPFNYKPILFHINWRLEENEPHLPEMTDVSGEQGWKVNNVSKQIEEASPEKRFHFFYAQFAFNYLKACPADMWQAILCPIYTLLTRPLYQTVWFNTYKGNNDTEISVLKKRQKKKSPANWPVNVALTATSSLSSAFLLLPVC